MVRSRARVVVVTGGQLRSGPGHRAGLRGRGADVALVARGRDGLEAAATEVEAAGRRAEDELGPADVWVNNAFVRVTNVPIWASCTAPSPP